MAEAKRLPGDKLTVGRELCANHNTAIKNLPGDVSHRFSQSGATGNHFSAARPVGEHQIMDCSNLPSKENVDALKAKDQSDLAERDESYPSSLRSRSTCTSVSLEISLSTINSNNKELQPLALQTRPGSRDNTTIPINEPSSHSPHRDEDRAVTHPHKPSASEPLKKTDKRADSSSAHFNQCVNMLDSCQIETPKSVNQDHTLEKNFASFPSSCGNVGAKPVSPGLSSKAPFHTDTHEMFYAFVILHAQEDTDEAVRIQDRLQAISSTTGATFSEDFVEPGRSVFRCVEDAIDNSAFTMLLLTANFGTCLHGMITDSALINSIEKRHKYNSVIPLVPRTNALTNDKWPLILKTINSLNERNRNFEKMARKVLASEKIQSQKMIWRQELCVKKQKECKQKLLEENRMLRDFNQRSKQLQELDQERKRQLMQQEHLRDPSPLQFPSDQACLSGGQLLGPRLYQSSCAHVPQPPSEASSSINIQHAQYIIIGDHSRMSVMGAGNLSGDEASFNES